MMPCHTGVALVCSRSIVRDLLHQRYFPATRAERSKPVQNAALSASEIRILPHKLRSVVHCHSAPLPESGHQAYTSSHAVNERTFFSSAKDVTLRESPLSLAKNTKTLSSQTMSAAGDLSAAAQHDDVDQSWKQGSFH